MIDFVSPLSRPYVAVGMHMGSNPADGTEKVFSMHEEWVDELEADYGGTYCVTIYCSPDPSVSISGPSILPSGLLCEWTASASSGVPPYSFSWSGVASGSGSSLDAIINSSGWRDRHGRCRSFV